MNVFHVQHLRCYHPAAPLCPLPEPPPQSAHHRGMPHTAQELSHQRGWDEEGACVNKLCVPLTWFIGSTLLWGQSPTLTCCRDVLRERVKTLRTNTVGAEAVTLPLLLPSSLLH